jgi:hypothetical protein
MTKIRNSSLPHPSPSPRWGEECLLAGRQEWGQSLGFGDWNLFAIWDLEIGILTPKFFKLVSASIYSKADMLAHSLSF